MEIYFKSWWIFILINTYLLSYYLVSTHDFHTICNVTEVNIKSIKIVCSKITINNTFADIKWYYSLLKSKVDVIIKDSHIKLLNDNITHPKYEHVSEYKYYYESYEDVNEYGFHIKFTNNVIDKFEIGAETSNLRLENNTILFLTINEESTIDFHSFDTINLNHNIIKHISPKLFSKLSKNQMSISMINCSLTKIPKDVFGINQMPLVALSNNHFTSIPTGAFVDIENKHYFWFYPEKTIILLDHCGIETIEEGAFQRLEMKKLNFSNNNIKTLSKNIFVDCHLVFIDLANNQIESINPNTFSDLGTSLERVFLKNNKISVLPARMFERNTALTDLDLTDNPITTIEPYAFQGMTSIEIHSLFQRGLLLPYIEMKQISSNTYNGLQSVKKLDLSYHFIEIMFTEAFQGLSSMEYLNLSYNNIEGILPETFLGLSSIKYVNLSNNKIFVLNAISFLGLSNPHKLLIIDLSYNQIKILPVGLFNATPRLTELKLDHNNISDLDKGTFFGLKYMTKLDLSYNTLSDLFKEVLYPMTSLNSLNIDSNNITQMDIKDILDHLKDFKQFNLNNNPWICSFLNNMVGDLLDKEVDFMSTALVRHTLPNVDGIACMDIADTPHDKNTDGKNVSSQSDSLLEELIKGQVYQNNLMIVMNWILVCGFIMIAVLYVSFNRHHIFTCLYINRYQTIRTWFTS